MSLESNCRLCGMPDPTILHNCERDGYVRPTERDLEEVRQQLRDSQADARNWEANADEWKRICNEELTPQLAVVKEQLRERDELQVCGHSREASTHVPTVPDGTFCTHCLLAAEREAHAATKAVMNLAIGQAAADFDKYKANRDEQAEQLAATKAELAHAQYNNRTRNLELDGLHYVWCDGGCRGGIHRFGEHPPLTQEMVELAVRNTNRLLRWFVNKEFKANGHQLPDWCKKYAYFENAVTNIEQADEIAALTDTLKRTEYTDAKRIRELESTRVSLEKEVDALTKERDHLAADNNEVRLEACILRQDIEKLQARVNALEAAGTKLHIDMTELAHCVYGDELPTDHARNLAEWDAAVKESNV